MSPGRATPLPAVVLYIDGGGIRPTVVQMAERLAGAEYVVLVPDLFSRYGSYGPFVPAEVTEAILAYLDDRADVDGRRVGAVGFRMGGAMAIVAAATYPERFAGVISFSRRRSRDG